VVPRAHDQFDNAARVTALGVGASLPASKLDDARLARAIGQLVGNDAVRERCAAVSRRFAPGQALRGLCVRLETLMSRGNGAPAIAESAQD
jgi:rhamnosyltransferase subunit B